VLPWSAKQALKDHGKDTNMANGAAALLSLPSAPSAPRQTPAQASPPDPVELEIGEAVASAAYSIVISVQGCLQSGVLDPELKDDGAAKLARVAELALDYMGGDDDFFQLARVAGRRALRRYFDDGVNPHLIDQAIDRAIDPVFEIATPVIRFERVCRKAESN
jgi:hypothetical protein